MDSFTYLRHSDIFGEKLPMPTLKKMLRGLGRASVLSNLSIINNIFTRGRVEAHGLDEYAKLHRELLGFYLRPDICKSISGLSLASSPVFTRLTSLYVAQLALLHGTDERPVLADGSTPGGWTLGEICLGANDYLLTPREERNTGEGSDVKRIRHLGFQIAPILEVFNPLDFVQGISRSHLIFSDILESNDLRTVLEEEGLQHFDIAREFRSATGLHLIEYIDITLAILFSQVYPANNNVRATQHFTVRGLLRHSNLDSDIVEKYLRLESRNFDEFRQILSVQSRLYSNAFSFGPFKTFPIVEVFAGVFVCIDSTLLIEKLDSGIYWKIFDGLDSKKKKQDFFQAFGFVFELYVRRVIAALSHATGRNGLHFPAPRYENGEKLFDEVIYYPDTKHLVVIETKSGFIPTPAKYGRSIREFTKQVRRKFVEKDDGTEKGVKQLAKHLSRILSNERSRRYILADRQLQHCFDQAEKVSPLLIVQERVLSFHIHEQALNTELQRYLLQRNYLLRDSINTQQLTILEIGELERLKEHITAGHFTLEQCINARAYRDPGYKQLFLDFVFENFQPRAVVGAESETVYISVLDRIKDRFFGQENDHTGT